MYGGGAISAKSRISLTFFGTSNFSNNSAGVSGGAISAAFKVVLTFNGVNNFINNSAEHCDGGAIRAVSNVVLTFNGVNNFINNSAEHSDGGAIRAVSNVVLTFNGVNNFINNSAEHCDGGAIRAVSNVVLTFNGVNNFINNSAEHCDGGAIRAVSNVVLTFNGVNNFINNSAEHSDGGAIRAVSNVVLTFNGVNNFINNSAEHCDGGAIRAVSNVVLTFNEITINFICNSAYSYGGAIFTANNISLGITGTSSFSSNSAMLGGAISVYRNSTLTFNGSISFINNGNHVNKFNIDNGNSYGGALYLFISSTFLILPNTTVRWESNHAILGGAINVEDVNALIYCNQIIKYITREECFFQLPGQNLSSGLDVQLVFKNNSADDAGSVLYGGTIDNCKLTGLNTYNSSKVFDMLFHNNDTNYRTISKISSDPFHICQCKNNLPDCGETRYGPITAYLGETFQVPVVAVGQRKGTVSSTVRGTVKTDSITDSKSVNLLDYQYLQQTHNACTKLNYTVFSLSWKVQIQLHPEGSPCLKNIQGSIFLVELNLNQTCPPGFEMSDSARSCICEPRLAQYTNQCNITNGLGQITHESSQHFWVGYNISSHELILHPHCPFDYCVNNAKVFPVNNTDIQCAHNRSGLLCGHRKEGYSLVLGTSQCRKCTNFYLALLIPFALMGVALVFLLLVCKLTVAKGTLSGLVFYANIVGVNRTIFLPVKSTDALSVLIAWLNLDFGIKTCFYDGLNAYGKTWLQFVFPAYLWLLVGLMILVSHFSQRFANLLGNNPVSVLATLILLSYAKILRTLITAVYVSYLKYSRINANYSRMVWLYDANIDYLSGEHIPLFLVAVLVFLFLFLPYTLLLLFSQWLQTISHLRLFSWVNSTRLKAFMDSYHAPCKAKHRYWSGLLLVLRFVLLLVFALNPQQDPNINLLTILLGAGILQLWAWVSGGVYKNWCLDALEGSFVLNLIMLVGATYYVKFSEGSQLAAGYTSASIAFVTFITILAYHIFQQLRHTKLWKKVPELNLELNTPKLKQAVNYLNNPINDPTESVNLDQLREPWLEDLLQPTHSSV